MDKGCGVGFVLGALKNNITPLEVGTAPSLGLRTDFARVAGILGQVNQSSCQIC